MNIGTRIRTLREKKKLTQQALAEKVGVTFQAVSSWERGEYDPDTEKLAAIANALDISPAQHLTEEAPVWELKDRFFDEEHMFTFLKTVAKENGFSQLLSALPFARDAHKGQTRKGSDTPYISHPLTMACHARAMGISDDAVLAAILLHDTVEDCGKTPEELPVGEEAKELVRLLTKKKTPAAEKAKAEKHYYEAIAKNPKAAFIKCLDRVNNVSGMAGGFTRKKMAEYIVETETCIIPLLDVVRSRPEYNNAAWLMKYQLTALLETQKRLL